jgi:hypothetical protein
VITSRRIGWAGHVAQMRRGGVCTKFWWGNLSESEHLSDPGVNEKIILRWICGMWGLNWIELAQYRDRWWALVNAVMNLRVP